MSCLNTLIHLKKIDSALLLFPRAHTINTPSPFIYPPSPYSVFFNLIPLKCPAYSLFPKFQHKSIPMTKPDPNPTLFTLPIPFSKREKRKTQNIIPSTHFFPSSHAQCKNPNETLHATATVWPQKPSRVTRLHLSVDSAARSYEFQRKAKYLYERAERCGTISAPLSFLGKIELLSALCHWKKQS